MSIEARPIPAERAFESDEDLAQALAAHDQRAWRQLFEEQHQRMYNYAYVRTGSASDADDIASTVFVEAVRGIRRYKYRGTPLAAWLFRIAHNETVDLLRRRKRDAADALDGHEADGALRGRYEPHTNAEWRDVRDAIGRLKPEHRDVLMLRLVEGRSVREVAAILNKSDGAVKVMQMRALKVLRSRLSA